MCTLMMVCAVSGNEMAIEASQFVQDTLAKAGFVAPPTKLGACSEAAVAGFVIDTTHGSGA